MKYWAVNTWESGSWVTGVWGGIRITYIPSPLVVGQTNVLIIGNDF